MVYFWTYKASSKFLCEWWVFFLLFYFILTIIFIFFLAKCSPGSYSDTGLAPCAPCPKNFFQPQAGQTSCFECPTEMQTGSIAAMGREECTPVQCTENACQHGGLCVPMGKSFLYYSVFCTIVTFKIKFYSKFIPNISAFNYVDWSF